jgi:hypothetical protein
MNARSHYNDLDPETRVAQMRDELELVEAHLRRALAELDARKNNAYDTPGRIANRVRIQQAKVDELEARSNELFGELNRCVVGGDVSAPAGYIFCRSCNAQTGKEAAYERASLCTRCWDEWTPSTTPTARTEGTP